MISISKRSKDKRTNEKRKEFNELIQTFLNEEKLKFIKVNDERTIYLVSSKGVVYKVQDNNNELKIMRPELQKDLHLRVTITHNKMKIRKGIHHFVASAFLPNPENKPYVHHINGDPFDNNVNNLMWVTKEEHDFLTNELKQYQEGLKGEDNPGSKYTEEQIEKALQLMVENQKYPDEICKETGISYTTFQHLRLREIYWPHIKCKYDISNYNKFRRIGYTLDQKNEFINIRNTHPEYSLKQISSIMNIRYETIKNWNRVYFIQK